MAKRRSLVLRTASRTAEFGMVGLTRSIFALARGLGPERSADVGAAIARRIGPLLPALGYGAEQVKDLQETIERVDCDLVLIGTPIDLRRLIPFGKPAQRVTYELRERGKPDLEDALAGLL